MSQWLRMLAQTEHLNLIPSINMMSHTPVSTVLGDQMPSSDLLWLLFTVVHEHPLYPHTTAYMWLWAAVHVHTHTHIQTHSHTHIQTHTHTKPGDTEPL